MRAADIQINGQSPLGVALIMPKLEKGLDPYGSSQMTYAMHTQHITECGYCPRLVDPRDPAALNEVLVSESFPILFTNRGQSKDWTTPPPGSRHYDKARAKILISLQGNPPFIQSSMDFHDSIFDRKLSLFIDHDSIDYARMCNKSNSVIRPLKPAYLRVGLEDEASWQNVTDRQIPILFVGTYYDPNQYRDGWRRAFKNFPQMISCIENAAELLLSDLSMSVLDALFSTTNQLQGEFRLLNKVGRIPFDGKAGQLALELLCRFANNVIRQRMLEVIARYPATIITTGGPRLERVHPNCSIQQPMEFRGLLDLMKQVRCIVSSNPNHMTGAITERVSNGMRRGAVILNTPNNALLPYVGRAIGNIGPQLEKLDEWLDAAVSGDKKLDVMGQNAIEIARTEFDRTIVYKEILDAACDPKTWTA
ncbi:MAG: hypothetical protein P8L79_10665 [Rhodospirillaceae bacterium]|nr:hypothetical protein [Rhodospirillaceae bacterium]